MINHTPRTAAWLASQDHREAVEDLSPAEINAMTPGEYARRTGRSLDPYMLAYGSNVAQEAPQDVQEPTPGPAVGNAPESLSGPSETMSDEEAFHVWRSQRASGGEGRGILDSVSSQSPEFRESAARHTGRTAYSNSNVEGPRAMPRAFPDLDQEQARLAGLRAEQRNNYRPGVG